MSNFHILEHKTILIIVKMQPLRTYTFLYRNQSDATITNTAKGTTKEPSGILTDLQSFQCFRTNFVTIVNTENIHCALKEIVKISIRK